MRQRVGGTFVYVQLGIKEKKIETYGHILRTLIIFHTFEELFFFVIIGKRIQRCII